MKKSKPFMLLAIAAAILAGGAVHSVQAEDYRFIRMWPTLSQHWYFDTPEDVAVDSTGYVYVADAGHHSLRKYTADGVLTASWYVRSGEFFDAPTGVALDRYGNVYAASLGALQKYTPDGRVIWYKPSGDFSFFYGVEVDGRDWVYVTDTGLHCVHVYTADGDYVGRWGEEGMENGQFRYPAHVAADRDGFIYVTDLENHSVQKFEVGWENGGFFARYVDGWGGFGKEEDGKFDQPYGIVAGRDGLYVMDQKNDRIQKFDFDGNFLYKWGDEGKDEGLFYAAAGLALDADENVYAAGLYARRIQKFTSDGRFLSSWQSHGNGRGRFENPSAVAIDADGRVYVLDKNNGKVQKFEADGRFLLEWGQEGDGPEDLDTPFGISVAGGRVYVADTQNNRVQVFDTDGAHLAQWTDAGDEGTLDSPSAVAVDESGFVYVADTGNHRILKFEFDPTDPQNVPLLATWGKDGGLPGAEPGEFFHPYGVAINGKYLYVADRDNDRIQKIDTTGAEETMTWGSYGTETGQFKLLHGVAVADGSVYAADVENDRVQVFDESGAFVTIIGGRGSLPGLMNGPADVAVAANGSVYVVDSRNNRIQVFAPAGPPVVRKAIVVAAGGPFAGNDLWPATQTMANLANLVLLHQGFTDETIKYLSPDIDLDQDADIVDVDAGATNADLESAIKNWAADADQLVLYITNHGKTGALRMNAEETLSASRLDGWLDALQNGGDTEVIVIYDACYSGGFVPALTPPDGKRRVVLTGTDTHEDAYFIGQGAVSFSSFFWGAVLSGQNLEAAVGIADAGMDGLQHPLLDADGDGVPGEVEDLAIARTIRIGNGTDIFSQAPAIDAFTVSPPGADGGAALLATGVTDPDGVARVWATVSPPDFQASDAQDSVLDLPDVTLIPRGEGRYEAVFRGFGKQGGYTFRLYARDRLGYTAVFPPRTINLENPLRRRALLVAGHAASPEMASAVAEAAELARSALIFQGYDDVEEIRLLTDAAGIPGIDGPAGTDEIQGALTDWATGTRDLLFWFAGAGADGAVQLNADEILTPETLAALLAPIRASIPGSVTVILDAAGAGAAVPVLAAGPAGKTIVMASAPRDRNAVLEADGAVSFSGFFWRDILKGENAAVAFRNAQDGLRLVAGVADESGPVLDADGNGIGNAWEDTRYAADLVIGSGVRLTADIPGAQAGTGAIPVTGDSPAPIRVSGVVSAAGMDAVWAVISPPDVGMGNAASVQARVALVPAEPGVYEATHDDWPWHGPYGVAVFGRDVDGAVSRLAEFQAIRQDGADVYENDGDPDNIPVCVVAYPAPQHRSFHDGDDGDRARFFAVAGEVYTLKAGNPGRDCDIVMAIQSADGRTVATENAGGSGVPEQLAWRCPETGIYTVLLTNDAASGGANAGYEFSIDREVGAFFGYLRGRIEDAATGEPIVLAKIGTDANGAALSRNSGGFLMFHEPGSFDITISASGYEPMTLPATAVSEGGSTVLDIRLTAKASPPVTPPDDPDWFPAAFIAAPVAPVSIVAGESVDFRGGVSSGNAPFTYAWDFSDAAAPSTRLDPGPVVFAEPGAYRVTFAVTDADGDRSEKSVIITVTAKPDEPGPDPDPDPEPGDIVPEIAIVSPLGDAIVVQGGSVRFEGAATGGNGTLTYRWTFDGAAGDSYALIPGDVVFPEPGDFMVRFVAVDQDGDRGEAEVLVTVRAKTPKPTLLEPADGSTDVTLSPILFAAETTDPPAAFFHEATRWQIAVDPDFAQLVLDRVTDRFLTALVAPELLLSPGREYFWRAQFNFEDGSVSEWAAASRFVTVATDPDDFDGDGIADHQAVSDADRGGAPADAVCVRADAGGSALCLTGLENVAVVESVRAVPGSDISETESRPQSLPLGLLSFRLRPTEPGVPVIVRIDFMRPVTVDMGWHWYDPFTGWATDPAAYAFAPDNASVTLTFQDGGPFDLDGVVNGVVLLDLSGPGTAPLNSGSSGFDGPGGNVGGGCFINSVGR